MYCSTLASCSSCEKILSTFFSSKVALTQVEVGWRFLTHFDTFLLLRKDIIIIRGCELDTCPLWMGEMMEARMDVEVSCGRNHTILRTYKLSWEHTTGSIWGGKDSSAEMGGRNPFSHLVDDPHYWWCFAIFSGECKKEGCFLVIWEIGQI